MCDVGRIRRASACDSCFTRFSLAGGLHETVVRRSRTGRECCSLLVTLSAVAAGAAAWCSEGTGRQGECHRACAATARREAESVRHLDAIEPRRGAGQRAGRTTSLGDVRQCRGWIQGRPAAPAVGGGACEEARGRVGEPRRLVLAARSARVPPRPAAARDDSHAATDVHHLRIELRPSYHLHRRPASPAAGRAAAGTGTGTPSGAGRATRSWWSRTTSGAR